MQIKAFGIFASLCSVAVTPYTLFKSLSKSQDTSAPSNSISLVGEDESELKKLDNFFVTYCRKARDTVIVCKNREGFPWPEFYFVDKTEGSEKPQKIQSFIFQVVDKVLILEFELERGQRKKIDGLPTGLGLELFEKISLEPDSDCILLDNSAGGACKSPIPLLVK